MYNLDNERLRFGGKICLHLRIEKHYTCRLFRLERAVSGVMLTATQRHMPEETNHHNHHGRTFKLSLSLIRTFTYCTYKPHTLRYLSLHYITLHYITLHYPNQSTTSCIFHKVKIFPVRNMECRGVEVKLHAFLTSVFDRDE